MTRERERRVLRAAGAAAGFLVVSLLACAALVACDPPPVDRVLALPPPTGPVTVVTTSFEDGVVAADEPLVLELSAPLDPASASSRSVRLERTGTRRPVRVSVTCDGARLRIVPDAARPPSAGESLLLVVEGAPSPRAIVAADGRPLAARFQALVKVDRDASDIEGPRLVGSHPEDGAVDVAPGTSVELNFSEPLATGSVRAGDAATLHVDGVPVAVRVRASSDRRRVLLRPVVPVPPDAVVDVEVHRWVSDRQGNPLAESSARRIRFRTAASSLHEISEEFVCDDMADRAATAAGWGEPEDPGLLVPRCGGACALDGETLPAANLGEREAVRFQVLLRPEDGAGTLVSGLRLRFAAAGETAEGPVRAAAVEGGIFGLDALEPSFGGNRRYARLSALAAAEGPVGWESDGRGGAVVDLPFETPLVLEGAGPVLFDVSLRLSEGARLGAERDPERRALVEGAGRERLRPLVALVLSGGAPGARSKWYDAGCAAPRWQRATATCVRPDAGVRVSVEYQVAPDDGTGAPDEVSASPWSQDLGVMPPWRFVRFRVRFEGTASSGLPPAVDAVVMPYVRSASSARRR